MSRSKRYFDLLWAGLGLALLWPVLLGVAILIRLDDGSPVLFRQRRIGLNGKPFWILKFRTMMNGADRIGSALTVGRDPRITQVGHWLRRTKLDELPQLINIWRGEMSFVGPRPEVEQYVATYTPEQQAVLNLLPGLTDMASIKYCNENELLGNAPDPEAMYLEQIMPDKIRINLEYAEVATLCSDFMVMVRTVLRLFQ